MTRLVGELLQKLALAGIQLRRNLDEDADIEIAAHLHQLRCIEARLERRHALPPQSKYPTGLGSLWNLELDLAVQRRHFDFGAERSLDKGNRDFEMQIGSVALEERMVAHDHHHIEIARLTARDARFALAAHAQARSSFDARRHLDLDILLSLDATGAAATRAGVRDDFSRTAAGLTGAVYPKEALLKDELPRPLTATAFGRLRALRCARTRAGLASLHLRDLETRLASVQDVVEIDLKVVPEVGATLTTATPASPSPAGAPKDIAEKIAEEVAEIAKITKILAGMASTAGPTETGMAKLVVARAPVGVGKHGIGLGDLLEAFFRLWIIRIAIGMTLHGELAVRLLEVGVGYPPSDPQYVVIVPLAHDAPLSTA